ncbi:MAG: hypothetical protein ACPGNV_18105 [Mangrovicoccus sp.]
MWSEQIVTALERGNSPYSLLDIIGWLETGQAGFAATENMSASWVQMGDCIEVGHIGGRWSDEDFEWLYSAMLRDMARRGVTQWRWGGRRGWPRFLKMKGVTCL